MSTREMLINHVAGEECRIAIIEDGRLEEFYHERASAESHVSNIYQGVITNVEPAIQAAFVDFGLERNGFLHVTDVHPKYFPGKDREEFEKVGHKTARRDRPPIEKCFRRGQKVLVQVLKEGIGTKGPTVTSYLSIPGRFLVMMPDMQKHGVSRKTEDEDARAAMRDILKDLKPPAEFGFIVRTAGIGQTKTDLKRDLAYLIRLWKNIERKRKTIGRTGELYTESDLVIRTIRDVFTSDISRVVVDEVKAAQRAHDFLAVANPRSKSKVVYYDDHVPLFHRFNIEHQIENIGARSVPLPSGGALVIDQTEALVAVDVNSGKSRSAKNSESNAYQTNQEAVDEIARQLRLRDLGGLVVLDLIDMMQAKHRKSIEQRLRNNLKRDRSRTRIGPISQFGMLEMTRQRMRPSLKKTIFQECPHCEARGYSKSPESVVLDVMRRLALVMQRPDVARVELTISPDVAFHILNRKRGELAALERRHGKTVMVRVGGGTIDYVGVVAFNDRDIAMPSDLEADPKTVPDITETTFRELTSSNMDEFTAILEEEEDFDDEPDTQGHSFVSPSDRAASQDGDGDEDNGPKKKRRRRSRGGRRRRGGNDDSRDSEEASESKAEDAKESRPSESPPAQEADEDGEPAQKKKRRRRRRSRKSSEGDSPDTDADADTDVPAQAPATKASEPSKANADADDEPDAKPKTRSRSRSRKKSTQKTSPRSRSAKTDAASDSGSDAPKIVVTAHGGGSDGSESSDSDGNAGAPAKKKRRRRRSRSKPKTDAHGDIDGNAADTSDAAASSKSNRAPEPAGTSAGYSNSVVSATGGDAG